MTRHRARFGGISGGVPDDDWDADDAEFFDDRRLLSGWPRSKALLERAERRPRPRRWALRPHRLEVADALIASGFLLMSGLAAGLFRATSDGVQNEILESPWYPVTWLVFPLTVATAVGWRPFSWRPLLFSGSVVAPLIGVVYYENAYVFDPFRGASFAGFYATILVAQGALCWLAARIAAAVAAEGADPPTK